MVIVILFKILLDLYMSHDLSPLFMNLVSRKGLISSKLQDFNHGTLPLLSAAPLPLHWFSLNSTIL
ncbi:hypothetical protein ACE6H2_000855 [Prunus campanulata]